MTVECQLSLTLQVQSAALHNQWFQMELPRPLTASRRATSCHISRGQCDSHNNASGDASQPSHFKWSLIPITCIDKCCHTHTHTHTKTHTHSHTHKHKHTHTPHRHTSVHVVTFKCFSSSMLAATIVIDIILRERK